MTGPPETPMAVTQDGHTPTRTPKQSGAETKGHTMTASHTVCEKHRVDTLMVTGSRWWGDAEPILKALETYRPRMVLVGDAPGADTLCVTLCRQLGIAYKMFPAHWDRYHKQAGPIRNQEMINHEPDLVVAFLHPESKGTRDAMRRATALGIPVVTYHWDG